MERSEIRGLCTPKARRIFDYGVRDRRRSPDCAALHPGYEVARSEVARGLTLRHPPNKLVVIGAVCECFLEMDITTQIRSGFDCSVQRGQLDTIGINRVQGSAQHVYRRKASVARSTANYYYLLCKTDNDWSVMQNGHTSRMRPMDLVL